MQILAVQLNPIIGDISGNARKIIQAIHLGREKGADLIVFPELVLCGYPPEDFLLLPDFIKKIEDYLHLIVKETDGIAAIIGLPRRSSSLIEKGLYNSAALIENQKIVDFVDKILLPTYDVFDEKRYFEPGEKVKIWNLKDHRIAVSICEDYWQHSGFLSSTYYQRDPVLELKEEKISLAINISASPYSLYKFHRRLDVCLKVVKSLDCPVLFCNQVGANDSLIFDGYSFYMAHQGLLQCAKGFQEDNLWMTLENSHSPLIVERHVMDDLYQALVMGIQDYFKKLGFQKACLGLSGGIDSAVVACLVKDALGAQNVLAVAMPSRYSSSESLRDAKQLSKHLGISFQELSIETPFESYLSLFSPLFASYPLDGTEENLQARIRGMILMAISNKLGYLVLSTGNKSELAMGYSTLYGDLCGGLAVIGDVTKQQVYALASWINRHEEVIPQYILDRPPSAELRPNQKDADTLPDYAIVDSVLQAYLEDFRSPEWISESFNYPLPLVQSLIKRIHDNEYKRRQAPPCLRVSEKAFSVGRKFPIVQRWV